MVDSFFTCRSCVELRVVGTQRVDGYMNRNKNGAINKHGTEPPLRFRTPFKVQNSV